MNKLMIVTLALASLGFMSCGGDDDDKVSNVGDATITVAPAETFQLTHEKQTLNLTITVDQGWDLSSSADWCKLSRSGGLKNAAVPVTIEVAENGGIDERVATLTIACLKTKKEINITQLPAATVELSAKELSVGGQSVTTAFTVKSNTNWTASCESAWVKLTPASGQAGETEVTVEVEANSEKADRVAEIKVTYSEGEKTVKLTQLSDAIVAPEGYHLVWNDEFNDPNINMPDQSKWWYEVWDPGFVNHELQRYVAGKQGNNITAEVKDGFLFIRAIKTATEVISARVNTSQAWTYGYFEARLKLPKGKGTWPAFWMMPKAGGSWPACGEIDIMEEVGVNPNYTSSSIHCEAYNHVKGTQKTAERLTPGAEDEFHVYALEWTPDGIKTYVDGKKLLDFPNDKKGDVKTWPFNKPFQLKLNLAWGGDWGGWNGVDESKLPATYTIDYVRVFQK